VQSEICELFQKKGYLSWFVDVLLILVEFR
jgi:hypothetical protein